jgi:rod shape determining protein RodA
VAVHVLDRTPRLHRRSTPPILLALRQVDYTLVIATIALTVIGLVMVYSATKEIYPAEPNYFLKRQIVYAIAGFLAMILCASIDYRRLEDLGYYIYGAVIVALIGVIGVGHSSNGSERWISVAGIQFQPSEFALLAVICAVSLYLARHRRELGVKRIVALCVMTGVPALLVVKQPDLGTAMLMGIVLFVMLFIAGVRARFLLALLAIVAVGLATAVFIHLVPSYQLDRLTAFLHQNSNIQGAGWNLLQSKTAIASGGLTGTGLFKGAQTSLGYVPEQYADFIFSAIGEQLGFVGSAVVIGLFALVALRVFRAVQTARDELGRLICAGILAIVVFSVFENIGMSSGIMPITGIPLPFISYGGSALIAFFCAIGLVLNVEMRRSRPR